MNIEELTLKQVRELQNLLAPQAQLNLPIHPLLGKNVIVRTITMIYTGKLVEVTPPGLDPCGLLMDTRDGSLHAIRS